MTKGRVVDLSLYRVHRRILRMLDNGDLDEYPSFAELMVEYIAEVIQALPESEALHPDWSKLNPVFRRIYLNR